MKRYCFLILTLFPLLLFAQNENFEKGQLYLKFNQSEEVKSSTELNRIIKDELSLNAIASDAFKTSDPKLDRIFFIQFNPEIDPQKLITKLNKIEGVEYAEQVPKHEFFHTPNDLSTSQYNLKNIQAEDAWDLSKGNANIVVAIVDDAVLLNHQDLSPNIWINTGEIANNNIDDDGNGWVDDVNGWDAADYDNDPNPVSNASSSLHSHGTHCAGIVSAKTNNNTGIASIGYNLSLMPVKIGGLSGSRIVLRNAYAGVDYAIANKANVISMSWGRRGSASKTEQIIFDVAYSKNIVCIAAAGNTYSNTSHWPASYNHVISVASTDAQDKKSSFSTYHTTVDVCAPGSSIYSTVPGSKKYDYKSGTSMACPLVSGICGLMLSINPNLTPDQLETCLKSSCDNINSNNSNYLGLIGAGRVNAYKALKCLKPVNAVFSSDYRTICPGGSVGFKDLSYPTATSWKWSFTGGTPNTSTAQNPTVTYNTAGKYSVTLIATNSKGIDTLKKDSFIIVAKPTAKLSGKSIISAGGTAFIKFEFTGLPNYKVVYSDGTKKDSFMVSTSPYYHPVKPSKSSIYKITSFSDSLCQGSYSDSAKVEIGKTNPLAGPGGIGDKTGNSNLQLWLMADDGPNATNGNPVSYWQDHSGANNHLTASGNNRPSFNSNGYKNMPSLVFNGTTNYMKNAGLNASFKDTQITMFVVKKGASTGSLFSVSAYNSFTNEYLIYNDGVYHHNYSGGFSYKFKHCRNSMDKTKADITCALLGSSVKDINIYSNGLLSTGSITETLQNLPDFIVTNRKIRIGQRGTIRSNEYYKGEVLEVIAYNRKLTAPERKAVENYLRCKYQIEKNGCGTDDKCTESIETCKNPSFALAVGGTKDEQVESVTSLNDGTFILVGKTKSAGNGNEDMLIMNLDASGNLKWQKTIGGTSNDRLTGVLLDKYGDILAAGHTGGSNGGDGFLVKMKPNGTIVWQKTIGSSKFEELSDIQASGDGNYITVGNEKTTETNHNSSKILVTKWDTSGTVLWSKLLDGTYHQGVHDIAITKDGGIVIPTSYYSGIYKPWVIKLDKNGALSWAKTANNSYNSSCYFATENNNSVYIADSYRPNSSNLECFVTKFSSSGNLIWSKSFGGTKNDRVSSLRIKGSSLIISSITESFTNGLYDAQITRLDTNGNFIESEYIGGTKNDYFSDLLVTQDNEYLAVGYTESYGSGQRDILVQQICPSKKGCINIDTTFTVANTSLSFSSANPSITNGPSSSNINLSLKGSSLIKYSICFEQIESLLGCLKLNSVKKISDTQGDFKGILSNNAQFGYSTANIGDVNNDGIPDLAISSANKNYGGGNKGSIWVLFMNSNGTVKSHQEIGENIGGLNASLANDELFGNSLSALGDFNKDGIPDLMVGSRSSDGGKYKGAVWLLYLNTNGTVKSYSKISSTNGGLGSTAINGQAVFGADCDTIGDLNKDGVMDIAVSAYRDNQGVTEGGAVFILFMNSNGTVKSTNKLFSNNSKLSGLIKPYDRFGLSIACVGDINKDNNNDLLVSAYADDDGGTDRGALYTLKLKSNGDILSVKKLTSKNQLSFIKANNHLFTYDLSFIKSTDIDFEIFAANQLSDSAGSNRGAFYRIKLDTSGNLESYAEYHSKLPELLSLKNGDQFGVSIGIWKTDNDTMKLIVGAHGDDDGGLDRGAAYIVDMVDTCKNECNLKAQFLYENSCYWDSIKFIDQSIDYNKTVQYWKWDFGDGTSSIGIQNPKHLYKALGTYKVKLTTGSVKGDVLCFDSTFINIVIKKEIKLISTQDKDSICKNDSVQLAVYSSCGKEPYSYSWTPAAGLSNANISNPKVAPLSSSYYFVTVTDSNGLTKKDTLYVFVDQNCCKSFIKLATNKEQYCLYDSVYITNSSTTTGTATYKWNLNPAAQITTFNGKNIPALKYNTAGLKSIQLILSDDCGSDTLEKNIYINELPIILAGKDTSICLPDSLEIGTTNLSNIHYLWQDKSLVLDSNSGITKAFITAPTKFYLEGTDLFTGCTNKDSINIMAISNTSIDLGRDTVICDDDSIRLGVALGGKYQWSTGDTSQYIYYKGNGTVILTLSQGKCITSDTIEIKSLAKPIFDLGTDTTLCNQDSLKINLTLNNSSYQYLWENNSIDSIRTIKASGLYWVQISNGQCTSRDTITVNYNTLSTFNLGNDTAFCLGDSIRLGVNVAGNYNWNTGSTSQYIYQKTAGLVSLKITNGPCSYIDTIDIRIKPSPTFSLGNDTFLCDAESIVLRPNKFKSTYSYLWDNSNTDSIRTVSSAGNYSLEIDENGCKSKQTITISQFFTPLDFFLGADTTLCLGQEKVLQASVGNNLNYTWQDGSSKDNFTVKEEGLYSVIVSNQCGQIKKEINIDYEDCSCLLIFPTAFTPNDKEPNNTFGPAICDVQNYTLTLFNRWGEKIFTSKDVYDRWDGTYFNKPVEPENYLYFVKYTAFYNGQIRYFEDYGMVTLLR